MKTPNGLRLGLVLLVCASALAADKPSKWEAEIKDSDRILKAYAFPARSVEVTFPQSFPTNLVKMRANYQLFLSDSPTTLIGIQGLRLGPNLHGDEEEQAESPAKVSRVYLLPEVDLAPPRANSTYIVVVSFGGQSSGDLTVEWPEKPQSEAAAPRSDNELVNLITVTTNLLFGRLHFQLDARAPLDGDHVPALDFQFRYDLAKGPLPWGLNTDISNSNTTALRSLWIGSASVGAEGTYKLNGDDTDIADHVLVNASAELLCLYRVGNPLTEVDPVTKRRQGRLAYYVGARLKAFELEADQDFDVVNWKIEPQLAAWVPFSNLPAWWWIRNLGIEGNAASPLFVYAGYSFVDALEEDPAKVEPQVQSDDRFELELAYAFPLTSRLRLGSRSRFFWLLGEGEQHNYQELFARYYLDRKSRASVVLKYTTGALPPKFERGDSVGAGFGIEF